VAPTGPAVADIGPARRLASIFSGSVGNLI